MRDSPNREWMKLDNAALIYPATKSRKWNALFRLSASLTEPVDPEILQDALHRTLKRFPAFTKRLRHGLFWYYLEEIKVPAVPEEDVLNPCVRMDLRGGYMFRVRYHENRIAVEIFHVLTDGTGGLCFLKTLVAEYLTTRYGVDIPRGGYILDCGEAPDPSETEDSFIRYARTEGLSRLEKPSYCIHGEKTPNFMHIITGITESGDMISAAKRYGCSVGELMTAVLICSIADVQAREKSRRIRRLAVKVNVPVNLRSFFPSNTLRNFSSYVNPGIEPRFGQYTLEETIKAVKSYMAYETTEKRMNGRFAANVNSMKNPLIKLAPLPVKRFVMKRVYVIVGDRYTSSSVSNLGNTTLPPEMGKYVTRLDFMLGPLYRNPTTCACISYNGQCVINFTRTILESEVERGFFTRLVKLGIPIKLESNDLQ